MGLTGTAVIMKIVVNLSSPRYARKLNDNHNLFQRCFQNNNLHT